MADERTEKATPKRKQKAKEEGQVSKSQDLTMAVSLAVSFLVLFNFMPFISDKLRDITINTFSNLNPNLVSRDNFIGYLSTYVWSTLSILSPIMFFIMTAGIAISYLQVGPLFTTKTIIPDFSKLGPEKLIKGVQRYFQVKSFVELLKSITKASIIGGVGYGVIKKREVELVSLLGSDIMTSLKVIGSIVFEMCFQICVILFIIGLIDKKYQDYEHEKSIKMTKQEIKDERKNADGDPLIKSKIRGIQMRFAMQRMMSSVPSADVVVTNPTHYAIALRYDTSKAPAPQVVAKGVDFIAFKIREIAENNNITIVENKPLARTLYKIVPLEGMVPAELYVAVAEVLAFVYKTNKNKGKVKPD